MNVWQYLKRYFNLPWLYIDVKILYIDVKFIIQSKLELFFSLNSNSFIEEKLQLYGHENNCVLFWNL